MPNKTIYIRNEDLAKWEAIANKPEWLHDKLASWLTTNVTNPANKSNAGYVPPTGLATPKPKLRPSTDSFPNFLDKKKGTRG